MTSLVLPLHSSHQITPSVYIPVRTETYIPPREVVWNPPEKGYLKLNFDGGMLRDKSSAINAGIFRDHTGATFFSFAIADPVLSGRNPYDGEVTALFYGLCFAVTRGFKKLWIEGDAKFLIEVLEGKRLNAWYNEAVVDKIRLLLAKFPERPRLTFIHREGNMAFDALVKFIHEHPKVVWERSDDFLPPRVANITDRERKGYIYVRKASKFVQDRQGFFAG